MQTERILMVLSGEVALLHEGEAEKVILEPGESYIFDGGSKTESFGTCVDCNLMLKAGARGSMSYLSFNKKKPLTVLADADYIGFYLAEGTAEVELKNDFGKLLRSDFAMIEKERDEEGFSIWVKGTGTVVAVKIFLE
ncbi:MAG TPA: HutD family protein [Lachnospiraceae bacterium]|nr:HutD family protein [Lachnospiraceae bacterium]